jgi:RNA polymerase sigma-70 factor (ECF subfamily)
MLRYRFWRRRRGHCDHVIAAQHRPFPVDSRTLPAAPAAVKCVAAHNGASATPPYNGTHSTRTDPLLATFQEISAFLAEVERRAYKQALFALRDEHGALDVVQDAMLKLTEKYSGKPPAELPMLFQRILQNTIHDHFRRQKVRSTWTTLLSALGKRDEKDEEFDPLETLAAKSDSSATADPAEQFERGHVMTIIEEALSRLPARQREAFLLRYWEEFDVAETAAALGCSEGSVKTHCSRAVHALAESLKSKGITL